MKKLIACLLALACVACTPAVVKVNVPDISKSDVVAISDLRPVSEKERKIFSLMITSKQYGIWRVGDAQLSPSPVRLLQHEIYEKFASTGSSPDAAIYHLVVYQNMQSQLRHGAVGAAVGGVIGAAVGNAMANHGENAQTTLVDEGAFNAALADEYKRGLYTKEEDPEKASVYIVYIDTMIGGKRVFTRTIAPVQPQGNENPLFAAIELAIKNQLAKYSPAETSVQQKDNSPVQTSS